MPAAGGGVLALLDTLTFPELLAILVIALVVLGPEKLPGAARSIGEWTAKIRAFSANLESEVREVLDDPSMQPIRELGEFAAQPRKKLAEYARAAALDDEGDRRVAPEPAESEAPALPPAAEAADASTTEVPPAEAPPAGSEAAPEAARDGAEPGPDAQ